MAETIGIVGLGRMGLPVAKLLIQNGHSVLGSDRDQLQLDKFLEFGGKTASDAKTIAQSVNTTIIFVLNGEQIETVMEVILMARKSGLDEKQVCEVIGSGVVGSDYFKFLSSSAIDKADAPCTMALMCKDSNIVADSGRSMKLPLLVAAAATQYFLTVES